MRLPTRLAPVSALILFLVLHAAVRPACASEQSPERSPSEESPATGPLIEGIVLSFNGQGVSGARIRVERVDAAADEPPMAEGLTNATGDISIQLPQAVEGPVRVRIEKEGFATAIEEADLTDPGNPPFLDVTLEGTVRLSGTLTDRSTGKPLAGATVICETGGRRLTASTDEDGRYVFERMYLGPATLAPTTDGYGIERHTLQVQQDIEGFELSVAPEYPIELVIEDNLGKPAADATVEVLALPMHERLSASTDSAGRAKLRGVPSDARQLLLRVSGDRYVRSREFSKTIDLPGQASPTASAPAAITPRVLVRLAARIAGRVTTEDGQQPIVGVRVIVGREPRADMPMTWTNLEGAYELAGLEPGFNVVSFQHSAFATDIRELRMPAGEVTPLDARLARGKTIGGVVLSADGQPLSHVVVSADSWRDHRTLGLRILTGDDGRFEFPNAPPGEVTFGFVKAGYGPRVEQILTAGKDDHRITIEAFAPEDETRSPLATTRLKIGDTMPELTLIDTDGRRYELAELRGKYVFLDFWATWCAPCRAEIPNIQALHAATRDRADFMLIGVSLDEDRQALRDAVNRHKMAWPQVFGPRSGGHEAFEALNGEGIPYTCLIGPDGKLLAQDLRGPGLVDEVKKQLGPPPTQTGGNKD